MTKNRTSEAGHRELPPKIPPTHMTRSAWWLRAADLHAVVLMPVTIREASLLAQTVKNLPATWKTLVDPWVGKIPWRRGWQPAQVFLTREFHGQKSLASYSLRDRKETRMLYWTCIRLIWDVRFFINWRKTPSFHLSLPPLTHWSFTW